MYKVLYKCQLVQETVEWRRWTVDCGLWTVDCGLWTVENNVK